VDDPAADVPSCFIARDLQRADDHAERSVARGIEPGGNAAANTSKTSRPLRSSPVIVEVICATLA
jgi:hypothetical protein